MTPSGLEPVSTTSFLVKRLHVVAITRSQFLGRTAGFRFSRFHESSAAVQLFGNQLCVFRGVIATDVQLRGVITADVKLIKPIRRRGDITTYFRSVVISDVTEF